MPDGAVYVGRPSKWGNPKAVDRFCSAYSATAWFRKALMTSQLPVTLSEVRRDLMGKNLVCWCPVDGTPCHADVLLELANK